MIVLRTCSEGRRTFSQIKICAESLQRRDLHPRAQTLGTLWEPDVRTKFHRWNAVPHSVTREVRKQSPTPNPWDLKPPVPRIWRDIKSLSGSPWRTMCDDTKEYYGFHVFGLLVSTLWPIVIGGKLLIEQKDFAWSVMSVVETYNTWS